MLLIRKNFGPKGYGFGGGAGVLSMENGAGGIAKETRTSVASPVSSPSVGAGVASKETRPSVNSPVSSPAGDPGAKPRWGGGNICPKCQKTVYFAEQLKAAYQTWHKTCFTCSTCNKRLDTSTCCDKDDKVYCRACYGRNFGPKGVGYGVGAGTLQTN